MWLELLRGLVESLYVLRKCLLPTDSSCLKTRGRQNNGDTGREFHVGECCRGFATEILNYKITGSLQDREDTWKYHRSAQVTGGSKDLMRYYEDVSFCRMFMKEYDSYQGEAFEICEDRTYRFRNCRIGSTCLWVLFMFLLVLYFRLFHDIGKSASLFSSISLWCPWVFLLSTDFLAQFSHEKMSCSHSTRTWLNVKNHPPVRDHYQGDQNYHVSHLLIYGLV